VHCEHQEEGLNGYGHTMSNRRGDNLSNYEEEEVNLFG